MDVESRVSVRVPEDKPEVYADFPPRSGVECCCEYGSVFSHTVDPGVQSPGLGPRACARVQGLRPQSRPQDFEREPKCGSVPRARRTLVMIVVPAQRL